MKKLIIVIAVLFVVFEFVYFILHRKPSRESSQIRPEERETIIFSQEEKKPQLEPKQEEKEEKSPIYVEISGPEEGVTEEPKDTLYDRLVPSISNNEIESVQAAISFMMDPSNNDRSNNLKDIILTKSNEEYKNEIINECSRRIKEYASLQQNKICLELIAKIGGNKALDLIIEKATSENMEIRSFAIDSIDLLPEKTREENIDRIYELYMTELSRRTDANSRQKNLSSLFKILQKLSVSQVEELSRSVVDMVIEEARKPTSVTSYAREMFSMLASFARQNPLAVDILAAIKNQLPENSPYNSDLDEILNEFR